MLNTRPITQLQFSTIPANKKKSFNNACSDFKTLIQNGFYFVDKSLVIKDVINAHNMVTLMLGPELFGKTLILSMINYFFEKPFDEKKEKAHRELFAKLNISKTGENYQQYQCQFPVVYLSFKDISGTTENEILECLNGLFSDLYKTHQSFLFGNLLKDQDEQQHYLKIVNQTARRPHMKDALRLLTCYLYAACRQNVIVLIDNYDAPLINSYGDTTFGFVTELMKSILGRLKDNHAICRVLITGTYPFRQLFSMPIGIKNMLAKDFPLGFTHDELKQLAKDYSINEKDFASLHQWAGGYQTGNQMIYDPSLVIHCIIRRNKENTRFLSTLNDAQRRRLQELTKADLTYKVSENDLYKNPLEPENVLSYLFYNGYLTFRPTAIHNQLELLPPNECMRHNLDYLRKDISSTTAILLNRFPRQEQAEQLDPVEETPTTHPNPAPSNEISTVNSQQNLLRCRIL